MGTARGVPALAAVAMAAVLLGGCGDDDDGEDPTSTTTTTEATTTTTEAETTSTTTTTAPVDEVQPAIWPAADVRFATPEEAAGDFVTQVLGVDPVLGPFQAGDDRSGEIEVRSPGEGEGATSVVRGRLLLRQVGPGDGWSILAAVNDNASITVPEAGDEVPPGPLTVEGRARGFEATVVVSAFVAGDAGAELDQVVTQGGALEAPEPFAVKLDLAGAEPGDVVTVLVRGSTGLETDPGDFGAVPVVVSDQ